MHNLVKIKTFRILLYLTYPVSLVLFYPLLLFKKRSPSRLFFFLDRYSLGGAQRIYLEVLESVEDIPKVVYFTRWSGNPVFKEAFFNYPQAESRDIHFWCDYLFFRLFAVHYFAFYLNRQGRIKVMSANSTFFYDMLPFLSRRVYTIELLFNFTYGKKGMEFFGLANYRRLDKRMVGDAATRENIKDQYREYHIEASYFDRVLLAEPGVRIPESVSKDFSSPLRILYAGRGGIQKRVWLVSRIAEFFLDSKDPVQFHFAGTMTADLSDRVLQMSVMHGEIESVEQMARLYQDCQILILTSAYEGFPMVIKEAMAYGCIPVVTALKGNKTHLKHLFNAMLIEEVEDETQVVAKAIDCIRALLSDPSLMVTLSDNAYQYAKAHFSKAAFLHTNRTLLLGPE
jgi:glycosyltransferase involved in cell wall biosynthesis